MRLMNIALRFQRPLTILVLALVCNFTLAAATDTIEFAVKCNGVLESVLDNGYSRYVVGYLQDADGNTLSPEEFETYKGQVLYLPKSVLEGKSPKDMDEAKELYAAIAAAHEARKAKIKRKNCQLLTSA